MMDCVDLRRYEYENDGFCWILNVIDTYTKYLWSFKMKNKSASLVKDCLEQLFNNYSLPYEIQSDNGREFKNQLLRNYLLSLNVRIIHKRPRNPKAQGQIERANQTVKRRLGKCLFGKLEMRWIDELERVVLDTIVQSIQLLGNHVFCYSMEIMVSEHYQLEE
ncbi:hypothetical protein ENBRE01_2332 [Enteropsectra breve]|nr:hypothetical protein ENBRE01_2332 [Enteropsectra breve]